MIVTRPVRFTGSMAAHRRLFEALGAQCLSDHGDRAVYGFDHGRIALHTADETYPAGLTAPPMASRSPSIRSHRSQSALTHRWWPRNRGEAAMQRQQDREPSQPEPVSPGRR
ncbi:hypothetical protein [Pseudactinotalea sp. Z1732]|uniref:hypothetical protein n=1 Tax=Micrococcales TaxID=85006 RepID=UPI003C7DB33F